MPLDFGQLSGGSSSDSVIVPREIFSVLPKKNRKYTYLRDVQAEVLSQWFDRRNDANITLKMNTGSGKTVVGLLILKSCLNENKGPAAYIAPTPYLVQQVITEAQGLGIDVTEDPRSTVYARGKAILVANIYKLINGQSVFGVGDEGVRIPIGSLLLDDAHACLDTAEDQVTLKVKSPHAVYTELLALFLADLKQQSLAAALDVEEGDPNKNMLVPFWSWKDKQSDVNRILHSHRNDEDLRFKWPLLCEHLHLCSCVFGGGDVEIAPPCVPIGMIPSFGETTRRIFMSATVSDDSVLMSHFNVPSSSLSKAVCPLNANDIGDRMILIPQELNSTLTDMELKGLCSNLAKKWNVVVVVPSGYRARFWSDVSQMTLTADSLSDVDQLKQKHVGLVVLINKYDGIDLPDDACRVLVIDGLPDVRRRIDRVEQGILADSQLVIAQSIQRIEQGMGRGIRSNDDYCAVLLMGRSLTSHLYAQRGLNLLTPATRAQFDLSVKVSKQLEGSSVSDIRDAIVHCLGRNPQWVEASRLALIHVKYAAIQTVDGDVEAQRSAFNAAEVHDYQEACDKMQEAVNNTNEKRLKGWLKYQLGGYQHHLDPSQAQVLVKAAKDLNPRVPKPIAGITYSRLNQSTADQALQCIKSLQSRYDDGNGFVIEMNGLLDDLDFRPDSAAVFERTVADIARLIGFSSQQPESEFGVGPDVLWSVGERKYFVIECKNGCTTNTINKHDCNQLGGSMNWFGREYDGACSALPIIIHPSKIFEKAATPPAGSRVITMETLPGLREALRTFATSVSQRPKFGTQAEVAAILAQLSLTRSEFLKRFTEDAVIQRRAG